MHLGSVKPSMFEHMLTDIGLCSSLQWSLPVSPSSRGFGINMASVKYSKKWLHLIFNWHSDSILFKFLKYGLINFVKSTWEHVLCGSSTMALMSLPCPQMVKVSLAWCTLKLFKVWLHIDHIAEVQIIEIEGHDIFSGLSWQVPGNNRPIFK